MIKLISKVKYNIQDQDIFPTCNVEIHGPKLVIKGMSLKVATPLVQKNLSLILSYALLTLFPGSKCSLGKPSNIINSPFVTSFGGVMGSTCNIQNIIINK